MKTYADIHRGKGTHEVADDEVEELLVDDAALTRQIGMTVKQALDSDDFKPPLLPEVAISLAEMAGKKDISIKKVEMVVKRDPNVAAKVVAVANSAFYSRGIAIRSLRSAISLPLSRSTKQTEILGSMKRLLASTAEK